VTSASDAPGGALSFEPRPGSRPVASMAIAHAAMEARLILRNGEQLLIAIVIPLLLLVGGAESGGVVDLGPGRRIDILTPGVFALAVMSTSFTSLAIATAFERRYGVLKRLGASPLPRSGLLLGKALSVLAIEIGQLAVIAVVALALGWEPSGGLGGAAAAVVLVVLGTAAFASLGLLLAGTVRAEATLAAANLVYVVLLAAGAVLIPITSYPDGMQPIVSMLPSGALAQGLRDVLGGSLGLGHVIGHLVVLAAWFVVGAALTVRTFSWD
jgi:ABC-2 type transport system permease protein